MLNRKKSLALRALGILLAFPIVAFAQNRQAEALRYFYAGQQLQQAGSYDAAAQQYLKVISLMPQAAEAYASLGLAWNAAGRYSESAQALAKARKLKPALPGVSLYLGIDLVKLNRASAAIPNLKETLRLEPTNKQAYLWLGAALSESGRIADAVDELQKANQLFHADPEILFRLGEAYRSLAEDETDKVIRAASGHPLVHQIYGDIYKDQELWLEATDHYRRALTEDVHWRGAHLGLGEIALRQNKMTEAEQEFRLELETNPNSAIARAELAKIDLLKGNSEDALAFLHQAISSAPFLASYAVGLPPAPATQPSEPGEQSIEGLRKCLPDLLRAPASPSRSLALAFIDWQLGDRSDFISSWKDFESKASSQPVAAGQYERLVSDYYRGDASVAFTGLRAWLKTNPDDLQARWLLARSCRKLSLSTLSELLAAAPDSWPAHYLLAETYDNADKYDKAIEEYSVVEKLAPDLPEVHFLLGRVFLRTGNADQAVDDFQAELRLNPDHAGANAEIGAILVQRGEQDKGVAYLTKAVSRDPNLWDAHRELGEAYYLQKNFPMAETELEKAIDHDPKGLASYQLGRVYVAMGRTNDASQMFARSQQSRLDTIADQSAPRSITEISKP